MKTRRYIPTGRRFRKRILAILVVGVLAVGLAVASLVYHHQNYVVMGGQTYSRDAAQLAFSQTLPDSFELERLERFPKLKQLDMRHSGISIAQYEYLKGLLPECQILWSVPFQGKFLEENTEILELEYLHQEDLPALAYLPELHRIRAVGCPDYEALIQLCSQYSGLDVLYGVDISGRTYYNNQSVLHLWDGDGAELLTKLRYLPNVTTVHFRGQMPDAEVFLQLQDEFQDVTFSADFDFCGVTANTQTEFIDLSGIQDVRIAELESLLPLYPNLKQVDMCDCGISNEEMDALNQRHPDIRFVWHIQIGRVSLRSDATYFMPAKLGYSVTNEDCKNLKYCPTSFVLIWGI